MASPHPTYPYQGPGPSSYYPQPSPGPVYGTHSPGPYNQQGPYNYQLQQPPRLNGRGGAYTPSRSGHTYINQNYTESYPHPHQQQLYTMPAPQAFKPLSRPHPPSYANAPVFVPSWQAQQSISPLPKQLSMPPPTIHYDQPPLPQPVEIAVVQPSSSYAQMGTIATQPQEPQAPPLEQSTTQTSQDSTPPSPPQARPSVISPLGGWAIWSRRPHDPSHAPGIIISPRARPPPDVVHQALELRTPPPSPPIPIKDLPVADEEEIPTLTDVSIPATQDALQSPIVVHSLSDNASTDSSAPKIPEPTPPAVPSSSTTETTDTDTDAPTLPGSPTSSSNTSLSASVTGTPSKDIAGDKIDDSLSVQDTEPESVVSQVPSVPAPPPLKKSWASLLQPSSSPSGVPSSSTSAHRIALPKSSVVGISIPAASDPRTSVGNQVSQSKKKELLALLTSGLPSSTISPGISFSSAAAAGGNAGKESATQAMPQIRPRGLVNSGNMCFANSVLQILVYCLPFHRLFAELGRVLGDSDIRRLRLADGDQENENKEGTPLVNATIEFLKEFAIKDSSDNSKTRSGGSSLPNSRGKGKGREFGNGEEKGRADDDWDGESFLPSYIYDAMKEKKRFDNMRGGQQEDAEEFLGFYLDTLEEELLTIISALSTAPSSPSTRRFTTGKSIVANKVTPAVEETLEPEIKEDGWLEVGKKNRMVVTRTIKSAESPITRIFGGKFRSTLRAPQQKDSVIVEDWRALRLDIQRDHIHTIQDALAHISDPQPVQVTHPSRPGVTLEASQQVLIEALPQILVLHMKRFCYDTNVGGVVKVGKQVRFGAELDVGADVMAPAVKRSQPTRYKLFGVVYHHGLSASGGHYTLDVLHPNRYPSADSNAKPRDGWIRIDDDLVSDVRPDDVFGASERGDESRCAYLLFYRRVR